MVGEQQSQCYAKFGGRGATGSRGGGQLALTFSGTGSTIPHTALDPPLLSGLLICKTRC